MLNSLRKHAGGLVAQILMGLLVISFGIWGIADIFTGFTATAVAKVGGTEISIPMFQRAYNNQVQALTQQLGQPLTPDQVRAIGVPTQVMNGLVTQTALAVDARRLGLGLSNQALLGEITADPMFKSPDGTFNRAMLGQYLQAINLSDAQYVLQKKDEELRQQIVAGLTGGTQSPATYLKALGAYRGEERAISYLILKPALAGDIAAPTDDEVKAYYEANKANWRAPEYRALTILKVDPADVAKPAAVTDADAQKVYDANKAKYTTPETRHIREVLFQDQAEADAAAAKLKAGTSFDDLIKEKNLKPEDIDLGAVSRDKVVDQAVADAAFSLSPNQVSGVIKTQFNRPAIVQVLEITPAVVQGFDSVKDQIKKDLATQQAAAAMAALRDQIEDERAGNASLEDIAKKRNLQVQVIAAVDRQGNGPDGKPIQGLPGGTDLLTQAFESDVGVQNDPIGLPGTNSFVWYDVTGIKAAQDRALQDVRGQVATAWTDAKVAEKLQAKADEIVQRLGKGEILDKIGDELKITVATAAKLIRQNASAPPDPLSTAVIQTVFGGPQGFSGSALGKDPKDRIVFHVDKVTLPSAPVADADTKSTLSQGISADLMQAYLTDLQNNLGVTVNQTALQQAIGVTQ